MNQIKPTLALALLLAGCTVGPNYSAPVIPTPPSFAGPQPAGAAVDPATWWTIFEDPELDRLIARALRDNSDVAAAASRVREARAQEIAARAVGLPTVDASANVTDVRFSKNAGFATLARQFSGGGGGTSSGGAGSGGGSPSSGGVALPGSSIRTYAIGFDANWELDLFGGGRRGVEAAVARIEAAEWTRRDAAVTLAGEVAQAYFALRLDQQQVAIITDELGRQQRALQIAQHIARVGLSPSIDLTRQRAAISSTTARLEPIRSDLAVRIHALGILIGQPPEALLGGLDAPTTPPAALPAIPAGLPADILRRRPDVRTAERNLAAATADIGVAVADLYPRLSLTGVAQLISTSLGNLFSGNSLQLTGTGSAMFPLLDFGRRKATVTVRREQREHAYQSYRTTVLRALRDVEDALTQVDAERRRNATYRQEVVDREAVVHAVEAQYRVGLVAQDSLLNAQNDVLSARENVATSDASIRQSTIALFKALGGGWSPACSPGAVHQGECETENSTAKSRYSTGN